VPVLTTVHCATIAMQETTSSQVFRTVLIAVTFNNKSCKAE